MSGRRWLCLQAIGFLGHAVLDPIYGTGVETGLVIAIPLGLHLLDAAKGAPPSNPLRDAPKEPVALSVALPPAFSGLIIASRFQVYAQTGTSSLAVSVIGFVVAAPAWISPARLVGERRWAPTRRTGRRCAGPCSTPL
jgi:hypothetical protein